LEKTGLKVLLSFPSIFLETNINYFNEIVLNIKPSILLLLLVFFCTCVDIKTDIGKIEIVFDKNQMIFTKNSKPYTGIIVENYIDNQIKAEMSIYEGLKNGVVKQYYKNGELQTLSNFKKGKIFGNFLAFHENGNEHIISYYVNNLRNGSFEEFYENGKLKICGNYFNGEKIGQFKEYFKSGGVATYNY
tara:strand:- start:103 stop:669 length:567 start_codon:yes stop_codon:yes gene_type:complete